MMDGELVINHLAEAENEDLAVALRSCMEFVAGAADDGNSVPVGVNERLPFQIMGVENPDSYVCYDIGGTRYCYGHY